LLIAGSPRFLLAKDPWATAIGDRRSAARGSSSARPAGGRSRSYSRVLRWKGTGGSPTSHGMSCGTSGPASAGLGLLADAALRVVLAFDVADRRRVRAQHHAPPRDFVVLALIDHVNYLRSGSCDSW